MTQLSVEEVKKIELDIFRAIKDFCTKNNIQYYLSGGTMLGAIRHNGFIPWDDDIDISMTRDNYMRFIELFPKEGLNGYSLLSPYTKEDCGIVFSKVYDTSTRKVDNELKSKYANYGIDIDLFPIDGLPKNKKEQNKLFRKQYIDYHIFLAIVGAPHKIKSIKDLIRNLIHCGISILGHIGIFSAHKICMRINDRSSKYKVANSEEIAISVFPHYGKKEIVKKEEFIPQIHVKFENEDATAPAGYDTYLRNLYGNYMQLPPEGERKTHHLSNFYKI